MPLRIRSILVATDLTDSAEPVLRSAVALAALTEAQLHVVHAIEGESPRLDSPDAKEARAKAGEALRFQLKAFMPEPTRVASSKMVAGRPHHVILEQAEEVRADLIVIGPHRDRAIDEDRLGITADRLVRTSDVPCLIIHSPINLPLRSVCVPNDLSLAAQGALDIALVWAAALRMPRSSGGRTRLNVVNVAPEVDEAAIERQLERHALDSARRTGCAAFLEIHHATRNSDATADEIVRFAHENDSDLLVMGTHGQSALARELIGGVSSAVARLAACPVLLVPPATWKLLQARQDESRSK